MASHSELRPADGALALMLASAAMEKASRNTTVLAGSMIVDNGDGTQTWIGGSGSDRSSSRDTDGGVITNVGDATTPGMPTGLSLSCVDRRIHVMWDGTLDGGMPDDFSHITVYARADDGAEEEWGNLNCAGVLVGRRMTAGTIVDVTARAFDNAHAPDGSYCPNISPGCDLLSIIVEDDASMQDILELEERADALSKKADDASAKAEQVRSDLQSEVDNVRTKVDGLSSAGDRLSGQITDIRGTVNGQQSKLDEFGQKLEGAVTQNGATVKSVTELRQTVSGLDVRVAQTVETAEGAMGKATAVQQTVDGIKATLGKDYTSTKDADRKYSTKTELSAEAGRIRAELAETTKTANGAMDKSATLETTVNGISTKISEQATTLNATVKSVTELRQTVSGLDVRVAQTVETAEGAMGKATAVQQTVDGIKATLGKDYTSTKDADRKYSTKTELSAEAGRIRAELAETTKTANGAMDKSATLETTVNGISTKISEQATTLNATVKTANEAKSTADSNKQTISQVSQTASGALTKATTVEANLNSYKTTVASTYATNSRVDDLATSGSNLLEHVNPTDRKVSYWVNEGMSTFDVQKLITYIGVEKVTYGWRFKCGNTTSPLTNRVYYDVNKFTHVKDQAYTFSAWVKVSSGTATIKAQIAGGADIASIKATTTWTRITGTYVASLSGSLTLRCSGTTEWYMCAPYVASCPEWITNRSYVNQTSKSVALGVVQDYKGADGSGLATKSDITAAKDSITSTVSATYATKTDMRSGDATVQANVDQLATDAMNTYVQSSTFTQARDSFTQELSQTKQDVTDANAAITANEETRRKYMRFSGADTGDPQIELGASDSAFKMRLTNQRLAFMQGDSTPTYVSNQRLYINDAEVNQTLRIGRYAFIPRPDGHMSLQYVG